DLEVELRDVRLIGGEGKAHARDLGEGARQAGDSVLQFAVAESGAILYVERITRAGADAEDRRWHDGESERLLESAEFHVQFGGDVGGAAIALAESVESEEHGAGVRRVIELHGVEPGERDRAGNAFGRQRDVTDLAYHCLGAVERGAGRQLDAAD